MSITEDEARRLAVRYVDYFFDPQADPAVDDFVAKSFFDHVSGQRGRTIFPTVREWSRATWADPDADIHLITTSGDRMMVWFTVMCSHIGDEFPRLRGLPVTRARIPWTQVHIFRVAEGLLAEHWAVRDDYAMVEAVVGGGPLVGPARAE